MSLRDNIISYFQCGFTPMELLPAGTGGRMTTPSPAKRGSYEVNAPAAHCPLPFFLCPALWERGAERGLEVLDQGNVCSGISWVLDACKYLIF